jgi:hypothetical protein
LSAWPSRYLQCWHVAGTSSRRIVSGCLVSYLWVREWAFVSLTHLSS